MEEDKEIISADYKNILVKIASSKFQKYSNEFLDVYCSVTLSRVMQFIIR